MDIVPKFMMASGDLVDVLVHTDVTRYMEFMQVSGSFVYKQGSGICKVPSTPLEAASSSLMGFFEKRRAKGFFEYLQRLEPENPGSWDKYDLGRLPFGELAKAFSLDDGTIDFIGHSLALHLDDTYLNQPALPTVIRIRLYMFSMARYGKSPYIYPLYGLGELPQGFARLSAIYGGTYMLDTPIDNIVYDSDGRVCGVESHEKIAKCKAIFADPTYVLDRVRLTHQVIRCICILDHPIPSTNSSDSCQIIIPQRQLNRHYDVYITCVSSAHNVCPSGFYVAMVSTIMESDDPDKDLAFALQLLGTIRQKFVYLSPMYEPLESGQESGVFISASYDATSHFETVTDDVKSLYQRYTGHPLVVKKRPTQEEEQSLARAASNLSSQSVSSNAF